MSDQEPFFAEVIESIDDESREISLLVFDQGSKALFELYHDDTVLASKEFSDADVMTAIRLLMGAKRLREEPDGTLSELAHFMQHPTQGDALPLSRLAVDLDTPMDHLVVMKWRARWPSADEMTRTLAVLSGSSRQYLIDKAHVAIKHGEIRDPALIELVESFRQKPRPQPQPQPQDDEPLKKKKRSLRHPRRK